MFYNKITCKSVKFKVVLEHDLVSAVVELQKMYHTNIEQYLINFFKIYFTSKVQCDSLNLQRKVIFSFASKIFCLTIFSFNLFCMIFRRSEMSVSLIFYVF